MHCGIYYTPGSLKAKFCVEGIDLLQKYCDNQGIKYKKTGKLIIAKDCKEVDVLNELLCRGEKNEVKDIHLLDSLCEIQKIAPGCRGVKALWCPKTANVDFKDVIQHLSKDFADSGGETLLNTKIIDIDFSADCNYRLKIISEESPKILSKFAITCGGLHSEELTNLLLGASPTNERFISLKAVYQKIKSKYCENLATNVYPVPDLSMPFLGAHFSSQMNENILLGPFAIPALKVDGYGNDEVNITYLSKIITSCGFRNMVIKNFSKCVNQLNKAICLDNQIKDLQQLLPNFSYQYVEKGPTAVQCQILNQDGTFIDDFVFDIFASKGVGERVINAKFTPSPAATSCLAIANFISYEFSKKIRDC
ncbi:L-2-hydroxyglutarate dehydrogenase, mitochondrial-like isoform X2 [Anthonomus grandis grandis]|nr:L-2-hydroxyglutarate dehydrogenase, mitochondrial-like isoform X2 [Anthonomus grandis grandis]XP_050299563.1 L-2-hydroxyglutarate dehydrogenase, mitochondrial-like isoform X2 [Anthonomus grandis grandis]